MTYFPITCNMLTVGHIKALEKLSKKDTLMVGLLSSEALKGYKKELIPYEDRKYILDTVIAGIEGSKSIFLIRQDSLDPTDNIKNYQCDSIASGDGWEPAELETIQKLGIRQIDFDSGYKLHASDILNIQKT